MSLDPRIGLLSSGKFYCFPHGYGHAEFVGSLDEVEVALGLRPQPAERAVAIAETGKMTAWNVTLTFQHPAWDEVAGIEYLGVVAASKSEANRRARRQAEEDGHAASGKGRIWFSASKADEVR